jgi:CBS domain-containing protein
MKMKILELLSEQLETLPPEASIVEAAQKMDQCDIGALAISEDGKVSGLITDRDITVNVIAKGLDPMQLLVKDVMSSPVVYVSSDADIEEAREKMIANKVGRIVVLDEERKLLGVASLRDLERVRKRAA